MFIKGYHGFIRVLSEFYLRFISGLAVVYQMFIRVFQRFIKVFLRLFAPTLTPSIHEAVTQVHKLPLFSLFFSLAFFGVNNKSVGVENWTLVILTVTGGGGGGWS